MPIFLAAPEGVVVVELGGPKYDSARIHGRGKQLEIRYSVPELYTSKELYREGR